MSEKVKDKPLNLKKLGIDSEQFEVTSRTPPKGYTHGFAITLLTQTVGRGCYVILERNNGGQNEKLFYSGTQDSIGNIIYRNAAKRIKKSG